MIAGNSEYLVLAAISVVMIALACRALIHLNSRDPTGRGLRVRFNNNGTATMEFVLVFPILLFFSLLLAQTTLLAGANAFIHYAAFAATRSAIVQIPTGYAPDESPNVIINADGHTKHDIIRRAAVFALVPVSGRLSPEAPAVPQAPPPRPRISPPAWPTTTPPTTRPHRHGSTTPPPTASATPMPIR